MSESKYAGTDYIKLPFFFPFLSLPKMQMFYVPYNTASNSSPALGLHNPYLLQLGTHLEHIPQHIRLMSPALLQT
jgi:hypothetical protein